MKIAAKIIIFFLYASFLVGCTIIGNELFVVKQFNMIDHEKHTRIQK